jgi:LysM repeat protein
MTSLRWARAWAALSVASFLLVSCATKKEVLSTQTDLAQVKGNIQDLVTSLDRRQTAMSEELLELKRTVGTLKARDDEFRQTLVGIQQRMNVARIETDENLRHLTDLNREYQKTQETALQGLGKELASLGLAIKDVDRRLAEAAAQETDQNRRIGETVNRLNVFLEEATAETTRLKKGLVDVTSNHNRLVETINALNKEMVSSQEALRRELATLRESLAKTAAGRSHVIAEGETLTSVATRYGVPVDDLIRFNGLSDPNTVRVGQRILLSPAP